MISLKKIIPVTTVKRELMKLLKRAEEDGASYIITRDGKATGVLMSAEEYEGLIETLDILSRQQTLSHLKQAEDEFSKGKTFTHEQVFKE